MTVNNIRDAALMFQVAGEVHVYQGDHTKISQRPFENSSWHLDMVYAVTPYAITDTYITTRPLLVWGKGLLSVAIRRLLSDNHRIPSGLVYTGQYNSADAVIDLRNFWYQGRLPEPGHYTPAQESSDINDLMAELDQRGSAAEALYTLAYRMATFSKVLQ